ncbi:hypothetical protein PVK06_012032 [Gossypium arboreum]|uniref:Uncharacterized protein n=1 Tax=Gossypium arboreum TaxID=29729 RepID=A0ABR0QBK8_GOSAR|nr:hypothetical protein PVK06_012032 [Gossypium arboreum]
MKARQEHKYLEPLRACAYLTLELEQLLRGAIKRMLREPLKHPYIKTFWTGRRSQHGNSIVVRGPVFIQGALAIPAALTAVKLLGWL